MNDLLSVVAEMREAAKCERENGGISVAEIMDSWVSRLEALAQPQPLSAAEVEALEYAEARWATPHGGCDNFAAWQVCQALRRLAAPPVVNKMPRVEVMDGVHMQPTSAPPAPVGAGDGVVEIAYKAKCRADEEHYQKTGELGAHWSVSMKAAIEAAVAELKSATPAALVDEDMVLRACNAYDKAGDNFTDPAEYQPMHAALVAALSAKGE